MAIQTMSAHPRWRRERRRSRRRIGVVLASAAIVLAVGFTGPPWILFNGTPSEPIGLYWRSLDRPAVGALVAFPAPPTAFPYADGRLAYLRREPILKGVAAGPGDRVCAAGAQLTINGAVRGPIADRDGQGRALPHWRGCRALAPDELFVFSARVPNSFDSRYFGPIPARSLLGVYRPLGAR